MCVCLHILILKYLFYMLVKSRRRQIPSEIELEELLSETVKEIHVKEGKFVSNHSYFAMFAS